MVDSPVSPEHPSDTQSVVLPQVAMVYERCPAFGENIDAQVHPEHTANMTQSMSSHSR